MKLVIQLKGGRLAAVVLDDDDLERGVGRMLEYGLHTGPEQVGLVLARDDDRDGGWVLRHAVA